MKLKSFFFILAFLLIVVWVILLFVATQENGWKFYLIEGIVTFSLFYLIYFYRKVVKPLNSIAGGMDLLQAQDFSSRLSPVGQREADRIVSIFNRMMNQLKEERLRLREQNHFLDLLISVSPMGVIILTLDERISMANKAALEFLDEGTEEDIMNKTMDELERQRILQALEQYGNNLTQVATSLGLSRPALYRRLEKHNINIKE